MNNTPFTRKERAILEMAGLEIDSKDLTKATKIYADMTIVVKKESDNEFSYYLDLHSPNDLVRANENITSHGLSLDQLIIRFLIFEY